MTKSDRLTIKLLKACILEAEKKANEHMVTGTAYVEALKAFIIDHGEDWAEFCQREMHSLIGYK